MDLRDSSGVPSLLFLVTEDWFFASHFLPMARQARAMGLDVLVVTRVRNHREAIEATGARVIPLEAERKSLNPLAVVGQLAALARILKKERPAILHCIALRPILVGGIAARFAGMRNRVYALTGFGFFGARRDLVGRTARAMLRGVLRGPLDGPGTRFLFENEDDAAALGLDPKGAEVLVVGGAGVDPDAYPAAPLPVMPPLKIAVVARMLWSKGVDLAVEAVRRARAEGADVTLSLYGAPDASNPKAIPEERLRAWATHKGIEWHGRTADVAAVWRDHHVCCLPSRGGEGLPRSLLEGAVSGRAVLTTNVPGCRSLVRDGVEGIVVPPDVGALAEAIHRLAADPALVARLGTAARERVLEGFTEQHVMDGVGRLYAGLLAEVPA
ncbi:glycosyltransferase family 4 protein [Chelatococcus sp. GCM10030263]|uniref:glycosyltransferase family 4 protein n=1 Tax=Chelatococcus sp. GCM10030263 TaxID=3273387 RepID=UPI0036138ECA